MNKALTLLESLLWPLLLLTVGLIIVQAHAIPYWQERSGPMLGVIWSLGLEAAALWFLFLPSPRAGRGWGWGRACGFAVALVLVAVPLWQVTRPALGAWETARQAREERIAASAQAAQEIGSLEESLRTYERISETRLGWYPLIEKTRAEIEKLRAVVPPSPNGRGAGGEAGWGLRLAIEVGPVALSLVLFQVVNIVSIRRISAFLHGPNSQSQQAGTIETQKALARLIETATSNHAAVETPESKHRIEPPFRSSPPVGAQHAAPAQGRVGTAADEITVRRLQREVSARIQSSGLSSAREWCRREQVQPKSISLLLNYFKREPGQETLSAAKLAELAAKFLGARQEAPNLVKAE